MDSNTIRKIAESRIATLDGVPFQDLCDRLNFVLYPEDYEATRAAGKSGDMKCDGYCPKARIFFAAHATRGESAAATKAKIQSDLEGCLAKKANVRTWRYLTNDTLVGEVQTFVDSLRGEHSEVAIEVWDNKTTATHIMELAVTNVEAILDMNFGQQVATDAPVLDVTWIGASGGSQGHFERFSVKNVGKSTAMDCYMTIVGDDYEWQEPTRLNGRSLDAGQEITEIQYPKSAEITFENLVPNLKVVMEYSDTFGHKFVTTRGLRQELVPSGLFYEFRKTNEFGAPRQIS